MKGQERRWGFLVREAASPLPPAKGCGERCKLPQRDLRLSLGHLKVSRVLVMHSRVSLVAISTYRNKRALYYDETLSIFQARLLECSGMDFWSPNNWKPVEAVRTRLEWWWMRTTSFTHMQQFEFEHLVPAAMQDERVERRTGCGSKFYHLNLLLMWVCFSSCLVVLVTWVSLCISFIRSSATWRR